MVTRSKRRNGQNAERNAKKSACPLCETASVAKKKGSTGAFSLPLTSPGCLRLP